MCHSTTSDSLEPERVLLLLEYLWDRWREWMRVDDSRKARVSKLLSKLETRGAQVFSVQRPFSRTAPIVQNRMTKIRIDFGDLLLPLPPMHRTGNFFPCLHMQLWQPNPNDEWCCRLNVLLYEIDDWGRILNEFGFRIESPHGRCANSPTPGTHDFYHAQLLSEFEVKSGRTFMKFLNAPNWIPVHQPSFALMAHNTTEAILNLLVALEGKNGLSDFWKGKRNERVSLFKKRITGSFQNLLLQ